MIHSVYIRHEKKVIQHLKNNKIKLPIQLSHLNMSRST